MEKEKEKDPELSRLFFHQVSRRILEWSGEPAIRVTLVPTADCNKSNVRSASFLVLNPPEDSAEMERALYCEVEVRGRELWLDGRRVAEVFPPPKAGEDERMRLLDDWLQAVTEHKKARAELAAERKKQRELARQESPAGETPASGENRPPREPDYRDLRTGQSVAADDPKRGIWYGATGCSFWTDDWSRLSVSAGVPTCPTCGAPGFHMEAGEWFSRAASHETGGAPRYVEFLLLTKEICGRSEGVSFVWRYKQWLADEKRGSGDSPPAEEIST